MASSELQGVQEGVAHHVVIESMKVVHVGTALPSSVPVSSPLCHSYHEAAPIWSEQEVIELCLFCFRSRCIPEHREHVWAAGHRNQQRWHQQ